MVTSLAVTSIEAFKKNVASVTERVKRSSGKRNARSSSYFVSWAYCGIPALIGVLYVLTRESHFSLLSPAFDWFRACEPEAPF